MQSNSTTEQVPLCACGCGQFVKRHSITKQWNQFLYHHHSRIYDKANVAACFWQFVDKKEPDDCWLWTGVVNAGLGRLVSFPSAPYAVRVALQLAGAVAPKGRVVLHSCDNRLCVNPKHLYVTGSVDRFWQKVKRTHSCWLWEGYRNTQGYGRFGHQLAHRFAYEQEYGPIPTTAYVLHICDNPPCVRPAHLFLGSAKDNTQDRIVKGRMPTGDRVASAKLSPQDVRQIRSLYQTGNHSTRKLASQFSMSKSQIHAIVAGIWWKDIL